MPAEDLHAVTAAFRLGAVHTQRFLPEGLISLNWQLTADRGVFALKQIKDAPLPLARRNLRAVTALAAVGLPALQPLETVTGDIVAESGSRGYCLSWWITGQHLHGTDLSPAQARDVGTVLGHLHQGLNQASMQTWLPGSDTDAAATVPHPGQAVATADQFLAQITSLPKPRPWDLAIAETLRRRKELLRTHAHQHPRGGHPSGPSGWTHGDFHALNLIWNHDQVTGIVDWNRIAVRPLSEEVVRSASLLFSYHNGEIDLDRVAAFTAGYEAVIPLHDADLTDAANRRWWKLMCDYRYLDLHYTQGDTSCDRLIEPAARLLEWWTRHLHEVRAAFTTRARLRSAIAR